MRLGGERDTHSSTSAGRLRKFFLARRTAGGVRRRRKYRPGYSPANTQVGFSSQMTANTDLGIRFWTPSSVFVALPPLRQPAPPPAICGDSVAALTLERAQSPMVFSTTRDGPRRPGRVCTRDRRRRCVSWPLPFPEGLVNTCQRIVAVGDDHAGLSPLAEDSRPHLRHGGQAAQGHADGRADHRGARGGGGTHQAAPRSHGADRGRAALLLMSTTVLMQLLKLLVTFTVVLVTFTTLLVTFTVVLVQQFLILVTCEM